MRRYFQHVIDNEERGRDTLQKIISKYPVKSFKGCIIH